MKQNVNDLQVNVALECIRASDIEPKEVKWLYYPYIPFGKVTILQGDPGDGKSKLMLALAAMLSKGTPLPFNDEEDTHEPMVIIYQTTEDDADDTVVPRFIVSGGDTQNLIFIKEDKKALTFDDERIKKAIKDYDAKLLILDPLSSYIGSDCCINAANETRARFNHLIQVAKETGCAIVIVAHLNKAYTMSPLYRTAGSIDIAGAARSILGIYRMKPSENPKGRILAQVKSNLAPTGSAIVFEVDDSGINFLEEVDMTAEEAAKQTAPDMGRPRETRDNAVAFIRDMLKDGRTLSTDCIAKLKDAGFKASTYKKAKKEAGVVSEKIGLLWYWSLPEDDGTNIKWQDITDDDELPF